MKNQIYTIPINEAFDSECLCPICEIANKLDREAVDYTLGAAMMEPDFRTATNDKGFCKAHYAALLAKGKALPLALIMQSQYQVQNDRFKAPPAAAKKGLLKKASVRQTALIQSDAILTFAESCAICDKTTGTMKQFLTNIIFLWKTEEKFKENFAANTFCMPHFALLTRYAAEGLGDGDFEAFYTALCKKQVCENEKLSADLDKFTQLFDHRNEGTPSPQVRSALRRCIHNYSGLAQND